jgi:hypothetical protein
LKLALMVKIVMTFKVAMMRGLVGRHLMQFGS